jgi:hypothetical protein
MLFGDIIVVSTENRMKEINARCGQNANLLITEVGVTYSYNWDLKD